MQDVTDPLARAIENAWNAIVEALTPAFDLITGLMKDFGHRLDAPRYKRPLIHNGRKPRK